jgi:hypothetical protein
MSGKTFKALAADIKRTSVLRRLPPLVSPRYIEQRGLEGGVCAFRLLPSSPPIMVEAVAGRPLALLPGDVFLASPGHRESTRWVVGGIPKRGLVPRHNYRVLSESGVIGNLVAGTPETKSHLGHVRYLGAVCDGKGAVLNIRQFAVPYSGAKDQDAEVYLFVGTSAEVGKSTAALAILRMLLAKGYEDVVALKATGTSSFNEIAKYRDYGAKHAFDCVDFGLPTTYPSNRAGIRIMFDQAIDTCLGLRADAVLIECGGDMLGANVPVFLHRLKQRRARPRIVLAAADALGAQNGVQTLKRMGLPVNLITGPCTDTPTLRKRTEALCGTPTENMLSD